VCPPSAKLHLAYLHNYTEAEIRNLFGQYGYIEHFQFSNDPTMGFVTMSTVGEACTALALLHGRPRWWLRFVQFSCVPLFAQFCDLPVLSSIGIQFPIQTCAL
jgi:hypothetical protein